jgi:hypothetical protein
LSKNVIRILSPQEFKESPRHERIYFHIMDPIAYKLTGQEMEYFEELKKVFLVMCEHLEERKARKVLHEIMPDKEFYFTKYMNDVELIFGPVRKHTKEFQRARQRERIAGYIRKLEREQPKAYMEQIAKFEDMLMKLDGLHLPDSEATFDWSQLQLPTITYSSSTAFLSGAEDIEIIDDDKE